MMIARGSFGQVAIFGLGLVTALISTGQAQAQWIGFRHHQYYAPPVIEPDEMSPRELVHAVRSQGFNQPTRPVYHDEIAVLTAVDPEGQRVRLTLDVYSGQIVHLRHLGREPDRRLQTARPKPERRQIVSPKAEPPEERPRVVQRVPDQGPAIRRSVPDQDTRARATPEKPTIIQRAPLLPPQPAPQNGRGTSVKPESGKANPAPPAQSQTGVLAPVGSGTKAAPRRIDIAPPAEADPGSKTPALSTTPPI